MNALLQLDALVLQGRVENDHINGVVILENLLHVVQKALHLVLGDAAAAAQNHVIHSDTQLIDHNRSR